MDLKCCQLACLKWATSKCSCTVNCVKLLMHCEFEISSTSTVWLFLTSGSGLGQFHYFPPLLSKKSSEYDSMSFDKSSPAFFFWGPGWKIDVVHWLLSLFSWSWSHFEGKKNIIFLATLAFKSPKSDDISCGASKKREEKPLANILLTT